VKAKASPEGDQDNLKMSEEKGEKELMRGPKPVEYDHGKATTDL
jgi:hypothetical protein